MGGDGKTVSFLEQTSLERVSKTTLPRICYSSPLISAKTTVIPARIAVNYWMRQHRHIRASGPNHAATSPRNSDQK